MLHIYDAKRRFIVIKIVDFGTNEKPECDFLTVALSCIDCEFGEEADGDGRRAETLDNSDNAGH